MIRLRTQNGFTLIETLISILLLAIIMVGGITLYFHANTLFRLAIHKKIATEIAAARLEEIKKDGYGSLPDPADPEVTIESTDITLGSLQARTADGLGMQVTVLDVDENPPSGIDFKEIKVTIDWLEAGKNSPTRLEIVTLMTDDE